MPVNVTVPVAGSSPLAAAVSTETSRSFSWVTKRKYLS
jgi:hypothetical protein